MSFPDISTLQSLEDRPEGLVATGRMGGYGRYCVTQFKDPSGVFVYKHSRFNWEKRGNVYECKWYKDANVIER